MRDFLIYMGPALKLLLSLGLTCLVIVIFGLIFKKNAKFENEHFSKVVHHMEEGR